MDYKSSFVKTSRWACYAFALLALPSVASASPADGEDFRVEVTGSAWLVHSSGTIQASGTPIDLQSDLGVAQNEPTFFGRFVYKPGRKHRIVVEGTPVRLSGYNTVDRTIVYRGQTFLVNETVKSSADLNYFFAGYQYDLLSGPLGHLGFSIGGAYLGATGVINTVASATNVSASKTETIGLPLAGVEGRLYPLRRHKIVEIEGGVRGIGVGDYGHYLEASVSAGVGLGPFAFLGGYRMADYDLHEASNTDPQGIDIRLKGPIFSLQFRR